MKQKWRNRALVRGVVIDRARGYVYVRFTRQGRVSKELIGRTTEPDVIDRANIRAQHLRNVRRATEPGVELRKQRMLVHDAADLFVRLHGEQRESIKGRWRFWHYARLIKRVWAGRYVDSVNTDDVRRYRTLRRSQGVLESTINREHSAVITMFNRLAEWRRSGQIPKNTALPDENPGKGVKKVNEDRFIRNRLLADGEYQALWAAADDRLRRIIVAEMNLPLRLADLKELRKSSIDYKSLQFRGVQAKTNREYVLPVNEQLWQLVHMAVDDLILDFRGFRARWNRALRKAGLHPKGQRPLIQFRDLRRTAATTLHDSGVSLRTISAMLGHQSVTTTIRYLGLKDENLKQAGDVLAAKYGFLAKNGHERVESVPRSVPTPRENGASEATDSSLDLDEYRALSSMDRAVAF